MSQLRSLYQIDHLDPEKRRKESKCLTIKKQLEVTKEGESLKSNFWTNDPNTLLFINEYRENPKQHAVIGGMKGVGKSALSRHLLRTGWQVNISKVRIVHGSQYKSFGELKKDLSDHLCKVLIIENMDLMPSLLVVQILMQNDFYVVATVSDPNWVSPTRDTNYCLLPSLEQRKYDLAFIAYKYSHAHDYKVSPQAMDWIKGYRWVGEVEELISVLSCCFIAESRSKLVTLASIQQAIKHPLRVRWFELLNALDPKLLTAHAAKYGLEELEKDIQSLVLCQGLLGTQFNIAKLGRLVDTPHSTMKYRYRKLKSRIRNAKTILGNLAS